MQLPLFSEGRPTHFMKTFGENMKRYGNDLNDQYISGPWKRDDNWQKIVGLPMAGASAFLEGTDQMYAGLVDQRLETPNGPVGRIRRDVPLFVKNVLTLHWLRAAGDGFRLAFADLPLDAGDMIGGFRTERSGFRSRINETLSSSISA